MASAARIDARAERPSGVAADGTERVVVESVPSKLVFSSNPVVGSCVAGEGGGAGAALAAVDLGCGELRWGVGWDGIPSPFACSARPRRPAPRAFPLTAAFFDADEGEAVLLFFPPLSAFRLNGFFMRRQRPRIASALWLEKPGD